MVMPATIPAANRSLFSINTASGLLKKNFGPVFDYGGIA